MAKDFETTKIYDAAKDVIGQHYNSGTEDDLLAQYIAEDISLAVAEQYGKGATAKHILDKISYHVQSWCNPVLSEEDND